MKYRRVWGEWRAGWRGGSRCVSRLSERGRRGIGERVGASAWVERGQGGGRPSSFDLQIEDLGIWFESVNRYL